MVVRAHTTANTGLIQSPSAHMIRFDRDVQRCSLQMRTLTSRQRPSGDCSISAWANRVSKGFDEVIAPADHRTPSARQTAPRGTSCCFNLFAFRLVQAHEFSSVCCCSMSDRFTGKKPRHFSKNTLLNPPGMPLRLISIQNNTSTKRIKSKLKSTCIVSYFYIA